MAKKKAKRDKYTYTYGEWKKKQAEQKGVYSYDRWKQKQENDEYEERRAALYAEMDKLRKQKEQSSRRTDAWKNISVSDQNNSGNNYSTYAAKMMRDTPGALQREQEREAERIRQHNQPIVDRMVRWSQPGAEKVARQAFNDLVLKEQERQRTETERRLIDTATSLDRKSVV